MNSIYAVSPIVPAIILIIEGLFVLSRDFRSRLYQIFTLACFLAALWYTQIFFSLSGLDSTTAAFLIKRLNLFIPIFIPAAFHLFLLIAGLTEQKKNVLVTFYVSFMLLGILSQTGFHQVVFYGYSWGRYIKADLLFSLQVAGFIAVLGYGLFLVFRTFWGAVEVQRRLQLGYFLLATSIGGLGSVFDILPAYGVEIFPVGAITGVLWPSIILYTIIKHHLFDVHILIKRSLVYSLLTGVLTSIYLIFTIFAERSFQSYLGYHLPIVTVLFLGIVVVAFNPLKDRIQRIIDRLFYREEYLYREIIHKFHEDVGLLEEHAGLGQRLAITISQALHPTAALLFLYNKNDNSFVNLVSVGDVLTLPKGGRFKFVGDNTYRIEGRDKVTWSGLNDKSSSNGAGNLRDSIIQKTTICWDRPEEFKVVLPFLSVPLVAREKLVGRINLAPKLSGNIYSKRDLQLVFALASQTALAMQNITEETEKKKITKLFSRYVAPQVVNEILSTYEKEGLHLGGKRREVTILFADIRGFTSMSEKMEPEEVVALVNDSLAIMTDAILEEEGTVDKYMGDCVMAVFNAPMVQHDHCLRAVRAALRIQEGMRRMSKNKGSSVQCGVGINTGVAVVGNIGTELRLEYTVMGDSVNLASRLCSAAGGQVLISRRTYGLVKGKVEATEVPPVKVKGKEAPVLVYDVKGMIG